MAKPKTSAERRPAKATKKAAAGKPAAPAAEPLPRRSVDLNALRSFLGSIGSAVGPELILKPGRQVFHYTDLGGLLGIVEKGDLWLTHLRYSNDDEELRLGQRVATEEIEKALANAGGDSRRRQYLERLQALIARPTPEGVYICCFCNEDNLLSQWRGYGANGTGVSLQVDTAGLEYFTGPDSLEGLMRFWKVVYEDAAQHRIMASALDFAFNRGPGLDLELLAERAADAIQFFMPTFKAADFSAEAEWRLIFTPNPGSNVARRFRVRANMLVPYYSLRELSPNAAQWRLPIQHVTVGPSVTKELNVASTRMLLDRFGYPNVPADASKTPFRG